jgi:hypothetical protein
MAKIVRIKQKDIVKIVENIIKENDTDEILKQKEIEEQPEMEDETSSEPAKMLTYATDDDGNEYIIDDAYGENPKIVIKKRK